MLSQSERTRYARHLTLPELGEEGQERLKRGSVLVVGAGGLGSPAALYLAAAGVGRIGIVDFDRVDLSNLQRQVLFTTEDLDLPKAEAAARRLRLLNPEIEVETFPQALSSSNALALIRPYDVILDGTDNFPARYLIGDACVLAGRPNVYGSIFRFEGQASVFDATRGPCYRCLYPEPPPAGLIPSCEVAGVVGVLPGIIGTIQAAEAIKLIARMGTPLVSRLLLFDAMTMAFREVRLKKDEHCILCGPEPSITTLIDYERFCNPVTEISVEELSRRKSVLLIDVREKHEYAAGHIEGARSIPIGTLQGVMAGLARDREIVLYCQSGVRSAKAQKICESSGLTARSLAGGFEAWKRRDTGATSER